MKRILLGALLLCLLFTAARAEELPDLAALTGLDQMEAALAGGEEVAQVQYATGTKIERGFTVTAPDEIARLLDAVRGLRVAGVTDQFITEFARSALNAVTACFIIRLVCFYIIMDHIFRELNEMNKCFTNKTFFYRGSSDIHPCKHTVRPA